MLNKCFLFDWLNERINVNGLYYLSCRCVRISDRYQSRKDWFAEAHAIKRNVPAMEVSQGSRSGSMYGSSNVQHSVFNLGRWGNFSFIQGSALLTYVSQVGPKSQRLHTHAMTTPASENCVYKHRSLCWMFQIQDITTSSSVWLVRLEKLCKSEDICSLKKFMLLIFQTEAKSQMIRFHSVWGMFKDRCFVIFFP